MSTNDPGLSGEPEALIESVARQQEDLAEHAHQHGGHKTPLETVRESTYRGHRIVVKTTYSITVDDVSVEGHLGVSNDGQVHYHAIPNLGFASAIDLVEKLIDAFPDDFEDPPGYGGGDDPAGGEEPPAHDGDTHDHDEGDH